MAHSRDEVTSIDEDLAMFVGTKLILLSKHTKSSPEGYGCSGDGTETNHDKWKLDLMRHGQALVTYAKQSDLDALPEVQTPEEFMAEMQSLEEDYHKFTVPAQDAMQFVASHLTDLWS